ncbi:MAG: hypothetical protein JNM52_03175 [Betaproteobacteria bacterium]|nr:hypothetical protein [Betaproteobacteria bacterium]
MPMTIHSMEPLSARIPSDLYLWLAQTKVEGATTTSDKLRVLLGQIKQQHDGALDYVTAHSWAHDVTNRLRKSLVRLEGDTGSHSAVLNTLLDHLTSALALTISTTPSNEAEVRQLEDALVRRVFLMSETLLRQGLSSSALAYDPTVVQRHMATTLELAMTIHNQKGV